jgi:hypothetical protein
LFLIQPHSHISGIYSILPGFALEDRVFNVNVVKGSFNMDTFEDFIEELLGQMNLYNADTHPSKSVIVLDNCQIHKRPETLQIILDRYV